LRRQAEGGGDRAQQVVGVELGADELRRDELVAIEVLEEVAHQRRLPGADLAGDDDEALALVDAVLEVRERALVAATAEVERRIGIELERLAGQPVEGFVHALTSSEDVADTDEERGLVIIPADIGREALVARTRIHGGEQRQRRGDDAPKRNLVRLAGDVAVA